MFCKLNSKQNLSNSLINIFLHFKVKQSYHKTSFWEIGDAFIETGRYLINQATNKNVSFLTNVWGLVSVIFVSCFSGGIYTSIVYKDMKTINTYEEMLKSNLTLIGGDNSYLFHSIKWVHHNHYIKFIELKPRVKFEDDVSSVSVN